MKMKRQEIIRIIITGEMSDIKTARQFCYDRGLSIISSGPMSIGELKFDVNKFQIISEKIKDTSTFQYTGA
jgi:hypothetical protein